MRRGLNTCQMGLYFQKVLKNISCIFKFVNIAQYDGLNFERIVH